MRVLWTLEFRLDGKWILVAAKRSLKAARVIRDSYYSTVTTRIRKWKPA